MASQETEDREPAAGHADDRPFEVVEHTADWALRVRGEHIVALFVNAALGLNWLLAGDSVGNQSGTEERAFQHVAEMENEALLVAWLNELVYWAEIEGLVFPDFDLRITDPPSAELRATVSGGRQVELLRHVKAVTFHNLAIIRKDGEFEATIVFDV